VAAASAVEDSFPSYLEHQDQIVKVKGHARATKSLNTAAKGGGGAADVDIGTDWKKWKKALPTKARTPAPTMLQFPKVPPKDDLKVVLQFRKYLCMLVHATRHCVAF
jgi:hypothetical protein